jgi:hypothetical protein
MTDATPTPPPSAVRATGSDGGADFEVTLDRAVLLPGRLTSGGVRITFQRGIEVRAILASLIATEQWKWRKTDRDSAGNTTTHTETERRELQRLPVQLAGPGTHAAGEVLEFKLELPVPSLGPATFEGTVSRLTWRLEVKLDVPGFDASIERDVIVVQPTGLLMAGVVDVAQFALWPSADVASNGARGAIALEPVPLCIGAPFGGLLSIATGSTKLQEIRLELRQRVEATVSSGLHEEITLWTSVVAGEGEFGGERAMAFNGDVPGRWLPTVRLPHGKADAQFHVILAKALAPDTHLVRDVAICSTTEL